MTTNHKTRAATHWGLCSTKKINPLPCEVYMNHELWSGRPGRNPVGAILSEPVTCEVYLLIGIWSARPRENPVGAISLESGIVEMEGNQADLLKLNLTGRHI